MKDWFENLEMVPFMLSAGAPVKWSAPRLTEAVLIGIFSAGMTWGVMYRDVSAMQADIKEIRAAASAALKVQAEIVPMRNLQVAVMQEQLKDMQMRVRALELKNAK